MTLSLRRIFTIIALTIAWCALWRTVSIANIASGLIVSAFATSPRLGTAGLGNVRFGPLVRLIALVLVDLVKSTVEVATEILTPTDRTDESIIAVSLPPTGRNHFLLLVIAITLTPGTAVVDADVDTGEIYLHLLHDRNRQATIDHVHVLAELAAAALPVGTVGAAA